MSSKGCTGFLAHVVSMVELDPNIEDTLVVQEFINVLLKELPGSAHEQEVEFSKKLALNITTISKAL